MKESNLIEFKEMFVSDLNKEVIDLINKKGEIIRSEMHLLKVSNFWGAFHRDSSFF